MKIISLFLIAQNCYLRLLLVLAFYKAITLVQYSFEIKLKI